MCCRTTCSRYISTLQRCGSQLEALRLMQLDEQRMDALPKTKTIIVPLHLSAGWCSRMNGRGSRRRGTSRISGWPSGLS